MGPGSSRARGLGVLGGVHCSPPTPLLWPPTARHYGHRPKSRIFNARSFQSHGAEELNISSPAPPPRTSALVEACVISTTFFWTAFGTTPFRLLLYQEAHAGPGYETALFEHSQTKYRLTTGLLAARGASVTGRTTPTAKTPADGGGKQSSGILFALSATPPEQARPGWRAPHSSSIIHSDPARWSY